MMTDDEIKNIVKTAVADAVDFVESTIVDDRVKAQRYYEGEVDIGEEEGRSAVVSTKVRDMVRAVKPSLMRVFLSHDRPVEYVARKPEDRQAAEQATKFINYKFQELNGYEVLTDAFHDALVKKQGVVKVYWDRSRDYKIYTLTNISDEELALITQDPDVEIISQDANTIKVARSTEKGDLCLKAVPPEEFFVDGSATTLDDAYIVAQKTEMRVGDLVAMGYDLEKVVALGSSDDDGDEERYERKQWDEDENPQDDTMKKVLVTEAYMRIDVDGNGYPEMHKIVLAGGEMLSYEPWGDVPFAVFEVDPEPHAFYGHALADIIIDDQDASTALIRGVLDNIALTNNPRLEVVQDMVNIDDVLNNEIGGIIRSRQPNSVIPQAIPFVAGQTLSAIEYYDRTIEEKTGVTAFSRGLQPDSLQSTTAIAANATVEASAAQVEVMARNLAEGGMKQLFRLMLNLYVENVDDSSVMYIAGFDYVPVDPRSWNTDMGMAVNVGLGTGREDQKVAALSKALELQLMMREKFGPMNGLVSLTKIRQTIDDILAISGIRNPDKYFEPMNQQIELQLLQQQAQQQSQNQGDTQSQAYLQAEAMKAQQRAQAEQAKAQVQMLKHRADDDRERDKMDQDLLLKSAELLGKYGTPADVEKIKQMQAIPR